jgi:hypothetical protein
VQSKSWIKPAKPDSKWGMRVGLNPISFTRKTKSNSGYARLKLRGEEEHNNLNESDKIDPQLNGRRDGDSDLVAHGDGKQKFLHTKMKFELNDRNKKARMNDRNKKARITHQQKKKTTRITSGWISPPPEERREGSSALEA